METQNVLNFMRKVTVLADVIISSWYLQEAVDSRTFGPLPLSNIIGRAIYCSRSPVEHGFVQNR
jgi:type IV secretory pathway protease TraF